MCPTPKEGYYLNGKRVPSVSTILGNLGWGSEALRNKAVELTRQGVDYQAEWNEAAAVGTCAHAMIDDYLNQRTFDLDAFPQSIVNRALPPFHSFRQWALEHQIDLIDSEFPLVSSALRFGGTPDFLVRMGREVVLIDVKTSNWLFPSHVIQVVAYMDLIAECRNIHVSRGIVVRVGKDGTTSTLEIDGEIVTNGRETFYHLLQLHKMKSKMEPVTKAVNRPGAVPSGATITIMGKAVNAA